MIRKILLILAVVSLTKTTIVDKSIKNVSNSTRIDELNNYWKNLSKTVAEGDFEGYSKAYHKDAVIVFTFDNNNTSIPIEKALAGWKQGFIDTKNGKNISNVEFRFSQRVGDETTAHETGIFIYTTSNIDGSNKVVFPIHFETLLVKRNNKWLGVMEYQKSRASKEEWNALAK